MVAPLLAGPAPAPTEALHARALQLLERHGVLTREAVLAEGVEGGFAGVYGVLKALEERGQVRRGYFVAGLGAAQFALPGAVDRLRAAREPERRRREPLVLAATDPAQPYGAALAWPETGRRRPGPGRPARSSCSTTGELRGVARPPGPPPRHVPGERAGDGDRPTGGCSPSCELVRTAGCARWRCGKIDGAPAGDSPVAAVLRSVGFVDGYRGLVLRG